MKYLRFIVEQHDNVRHGVLKNERICFLNNSFMEEDFDETAQWCDLKDVKKFLPSVDPPNIIALGLNYKGHAKESKMDLPLEPVIFLKATTSITGHLNPVILPSQAPYFVDYEAELVIVVGKKAKNVPVEKAFDYIFGYTCGNDVSARDCQLKKDKQWARGKSFDTFAPIGQVIETEIDPADLEIQTRLNGKVVQSSNTSDMIFSVPEILSYLSKQMTLLPGTLIMTGTPEGVGFARNPCVFLREGDIVEVEIEGIGVLKNPVVKEGGNEI